MVRQINGNSQFLFVAALLGSNPDSEQDFHAKLLRDPRHFIHAFKDGIGSNTIETLCQCRQVSFDLFLTDGYIPVQRRLTRFMEG